jgi:hypothetical protein
MPVLKTDTVYYTFVQGQTHQNNDFDFALFLDWHF